jgi:hypothetical protein
MKSSLIIEIKFILTIDLLKNILLISNMLEDLSIKLQPQDNILLSGLVKTIIGINNKVEFPNENIKAQFAILNICDLNNKGITVKIENIFPCFFPSEWKDKLKKQKVNCNYSNSFKFFYFDCHNLRGRVINYFKEPSKFKECFICTFKDICCNIEDKYQVLIFNKDRNIYTDYE